MTVKPRLLLKEGGELALTTPGIGELIRSLLADNIPCRFKVRGSSMLPFIRGDDTVVVTPASRLRLSLGRVPVCHSRDTGTLIIHRLIYTRGDQIITKGDNCATADQPVPTSDALGCVAYAERGSRRVRLGLGPERLAIALFSRNLRVAALGRPFAFCRRALMRGVSHG